MLILLVILSSLAGAGQKEFDEFQYKLIKAEQEYYAKLNAVEPGASKKIIDGYYQALMDKQAEARKDYDDVLRREINAKIDAALGKTGISTDATAKNKNGDSRSAKPKAAGPSPKRTAGEPPKEEVVDGMEILKGGKIPERKIDPTTGAGEVKEGGAEEVHFGGKSGKP